MATKKSRKTTSKSGRTAKVELDAADVQQFESHLRDGLVASGAVMAAENKTPALKGAKVQLDPATAARLSETLRKGLVASNVVMATETPQLDKMTRKVKGSSPRYGSKKTRSKKSGSKKK
jgi:hypothetical protein